MNVTRRTFLKLGGTGLVAVVLPVELSALAPEPEISPTVIGHDLRIYGLGFETNVSGVYDVRRRAPNRWDGSGEVLLRAGMAAGCWFHWTSAPGCELWARDGIVISGSAPISKWQVDAVNAGNRHVTLSNRIPWPVNYCVEDGREP